MRFRALLVTLLLSMMVTACLSDDDGDDPTTEPSSGSPTIGSAASPTDRTTPPTSASGSPTSSASPQASPTTGSGTPVAETTIPDSPVGEQFAWALEQINGGAADLTPEIIEQRFTPDVLAQVPADQLIAALQQVAAAGPYTFERFWEPPTSLESVGLITSQSSGEQLLMAVAVEEAAPHRMAGLNFQPAPIPIELASWDDLRAQLAALAPNVNFQAAEIVAGKCIPLHELNSDIRLALGSSFKLYVLGELARKIETGQAAWDDELQINDAWKSLPSGIMQEEPAGTPFTLQRYAELMISISDNTAADHLIHALGRPNIEAIQATMGHADPTVNVPFLTTREFFALKLVMPQDVVDAFIAGSDTEQLAILQDDVAEAELTIDDAMDWTDPRSIDTIEWFASTEEMCRAMAWLHEAGQQPGLEPVLDILSLNPGVPIDSEVWPWVGFKGGSEPGVLNTTWLLERADGRLFVLTAGLNDPTRNVDTPTMLRLMMGAMELLADQE